MAGTIGIKIANGDFYPIIEENSTTKKRLVLTTVRDRQENVQIDFFRSISKSMLDAQYVGSLIVENLRPRSQGEPSIEVIITSDNDGNISADAYDLDIGGEHQTLNIALGTMDTVQRGSNAPDFDLEINQPQTPSGLYNHTRSKKEEERKFPWLIMGLAALFIIMVIAIVWLFLLGGIHMFRPNDRVTQPGRIESPPPTVVQQPPPAAPQPSVPPQEVPPQSQPVTPPAAPPVIQAPTTPPVTPVQPVQRVRPPAPVMSYRVPAVIPRNGVVYQIQWGDTLWDISAAFYRNPWLYPRIARYNNIRNPDVIISGYNIRIPPLN